MMFDFTDQVVVVTGAAGNLGRAAAHAFHEAGARLAVLDRQRDVTQAVFGDSIPEGDYCLYVAGDITNGESVGQMVGQIIEHFGRIDVLVNIAGGFTMGPPVHETDLKTWDFMLDLNAKSVFLMARAVVPHMLAQGRGKIVSTAASVGLKAKAKMGAYSVSKAAVIRLTESMAAELKGEGINVNCILPGTIDTPRNRADMPNADYSKWVQPESLADVILFLASQAAQDVHGVGLPVYGRSQL
jgi:NAD(P)-dependent dehydrogenase (short-subunit alcohol dehydrogenase family)